MSKLTDSELINKYREWCNSKGLNQSEVARITGMTRSWASLLNKKKIKTLNYSTRVRIIYNLFDKEKATEIINES